MGCVSFFAVTVMFLFPAGPEPENPWKDKVPDAVQKAERARTIAAYRTALDVTYRADDWHAALKLARAALAEYPNESTLLGQIARALWRGGQIEEAERVIDTIAPDTADRVALTSTIEISLARGAYASASAAASRLEQLGPKTALEYYNLLADRLEHDRLENLPRMLRKAARLIDPDNGYPEIYLAEMLDGLPEFFEAIGPHPINQIGAYGSAEMPMIPLIRLPYCLATINGEGPYRLIVDTGGSIMLALDDDIARELELKSLGTASIRGVSGKQDSEQALVDELQIGEIRCRRVMTRSFELPDMITMVADGIIGTGVFARGRMMLDFKHARLVVTPSSDETGRGIQAGVRVVGDAKLIAPIKLQDRYAVALLDSGADVVAISPAALKEFFPDQEFSTISVPGLGVGEGEATRITIAPGVKLELWQRTFENYSGLGLDVIDTLLGPIIGVQTQVLIGMPVFREMNSCTIDYPRRKMWVEWSK